MEPVDDPEPELVVVRSELLEVGSHLTKLCLQLFEPRIHLVMWRGIKLHAALRLTP
jgi:hypothetical protein